MMFCLILTMLCFGLLHALAPSHPSRFCADNGSRFVRRAESPSPPGRDAWPDSRVGRTSTTRSQTWLSRCTTRADYPSSNHPPQELLSARWPSCSGSRRPWCVFCCTRSENLTRGATVSQPEGESKTNTAESGDAAVGVVGRRRHRQQGRQGRGGGNLSRALPPCRKRDYQPRPLPMRSWWRAQYGWRSSRRSSWRLRHALPPRVFDVKQCLLCWLAPLGTRSMIAGRAQNTPDSAE